MDISGPLYEYLVEVAKELHDAGDGCSMCVQHTLDILNKPLSGWKFKMFANGGIWDSDECIQSVVLVKDD